MKLPHHRHATVSDARSALRRHEQQQLLFNSYCNDALNVVQVLFGSSF